MLGSGVDEKPLSGTLDQIQRENPILDNDAFLLEAYKLIGPALALCGTILVGWWQIRTNRKIAEMNDRFNKELKTHESELMYDRGLAEKRRKVHQSLNKLVGAFMVPVKDEKGEVIGAPCADKDLLWGYLTKIWEATPNLTYLTHDTQEAFAKFAVNIQYLTDVPEEDWGVRAFVVILQARDVQKMLMKDIKRLHDPAYWVIKEDDHSESPPAIEEGA